MNDDKQPITPQDIAWTGEAPEGAQAIKAEALARILNEMRQEITRLRERARWGGGPT